MANGTAPKVANGKVTVSMAAIVCKFAAQTINGVSYCRKDPSTLCDGLHDSRANCPHWSALINPA